MTEIAFPSARSTPARSIFSLTIWLAMMVSSVHAESVVVDLTTTSGRSVRGTVADLDSQGIELTSGTSFDVNRLASLQVVRPADGTPPPVRVTLRSGSEIAAVSISGADEVVTIAPRRQDALTLPLSDVRSIRFRRGSPATDPKWLGLLSQQGRGDLIAVRREGDVIDSTRGVVLKIDVAKVSIDLDGTTVQAPIEKLEGIVLGGGAVTTDADATEKITVEDIYGSRWLATRVGLDESGTLLTLSLMPDVRHQIPLGQLRRIVWSAGSSLLASVEPVENLYDGVLPKPSSGELNELLGKWLGPRSVDDQDLLIPAQSAMEFRIEPDDQRLIGAVGRRPSVLTGSKVTARIKLDGRPVWEETLSDAEPLGFDLELNSASRVRLEVDPMDDGDAGDLLRWFRPRLVK